MQNRKGGPGMDWRRQQRARRRGSILLAVLLLALLAGFVLASGWLGRSNEDEQAELLQAALEQALVSCYAAEGRYPASVSYLEEHYGVRIDRSRYVVVYEAFADNIRPRVRVIPMEG